jgi:TrmH family RNA methyltransferase
MIPTEKAPITSMQNPKVQLVRTLLKDRSARAEHGLFVVEGIRLAEEGLAAGVMPRTILYSDQLSSRGRELLTGFQAIGCDTHAVLPDLLGRLSDTETTQGILLVLPLKTAPLPGSANLVLVLDQVRDPGNIGTILRTAAAAGVQVVFITPGSVDPYMPKVVRAGMGAHFRLNLQLCDLPRVKQYCTQNQPAPLKILLADSGGGSSMWNTDLTSPVALVVGGEAEGASDAVRDFIDDLIHIPMPGEFESLNAGVAASILLYEIVRQRSV